MKNKYRYLILFTIIGICLFALFLFKPIEIESEVVLTDPNGEIIENQNIDDPILHVILPRASPLNNLLGMRFQKVTDQLRVWNGVFMFEPTTLNSNFEGNIGVSYAIQSDGNEVKLVFHDGYLVEIR